MYMIVGLGNPGNEYKGTRHNIGFEVIDKMAYDHNINVEKIEHKATTGRGLINGKRVMLVKPHTFMNLSGDSVQALINYYKVPLDKLIIAYDDVTIDLGSIRIRRKGSAGGQRGMSHIINMLGDNHITRVRVGIDPKPPHFDMADYVMSQFSKEDHSKMVDGVTKATDAIEIIIKDGIDEAMNRLNGK